MKEQAISRVAIILLAIVLAIFGIYHFMRPENMLIWMPSFLPGGKIWIYIVGVAFILVAIALLTHRQVKLAAYLLALMLFIFVLTIHLPNYLHAGSLDDKQQSFINLLKDTAIGAFALYIASNAKSF